MALGGIPPWLNVNPQNFVAAAQAGTALGLRIAEQQNQADRADRAEASRRWELEQRLRQDALEAAAKREDAARELEMTRRYQLASIGNQLAGNQAQKAHYDAMAESARARAGKEPGTASIVEHPETPGVFYLRNPSGAESPVIRPEKVSELEKDRFIRSLHSDMALKSNELPGSPSSLSRSNAARILLDKYQPPMKAAPSAGTATKALTKDLAREFYRKANGDRELAEQMAREAGYTF